MRKFSLLLLAVFLVGCGSLSLQSFVSQLMQPQGNTVLQKVQIVYAIAPDALPSDHVVTPQKVSRDTGAIIANNWQSVLNADEESPVEVLIIHASALPFIDYAWVKEAHRRGVVISFINVYYPDRLKVLGMNCNPVLSDPESPGNFFTHNEFKIITNPTAEAEIFEALDQCQDLDSIRWSGRLIKGGGGDSLDQPYGYRLFMGSLQSALRSINQDFE